MNLPKDANVALVSFLSASARYAELINAASLLNIEPPHPALDELEATLRDAEQALLAIFTAVFGEPYVEYPS